MDMVDTLLELISYKFLLKSLPEKQYIKMLTDEFRMMKKLTIGLVQ